MYLLFTLVFLTFPVDKYNADHSEINLYFSERVYYDTSRVLILLKNGIEGLIKEFPGKVVTIEFSQAQDPSLSYANILVNGQLIFIYTIEIKGYSIVGYSDLRQEKKNVISID